MELLQGKAGFSYAARRAGAVGTQAGLVLFHLSAGGSSRGRVGKGTKYPLQNARLTADFPLGVSNETLPGGAEISVQKAVYCW